jgi:hypothetical protein
MITSCPDVVNLPKARSSTLARCKRAAVQVICLRYTQPIRQERRERWGKEPPSRAMNLFPRSYVRRKMIRRPVDDGDHGDRQ